MRHTLILLVVFLLGTATLLAQDFGCDGERYLTNVFSDIDVTYDVVYGEGTTLAGVSTTLHMDIYEPVDDPVAERPLVVLAHGGAFIAGDKSDLALICSDLATRGYVVASIQYRLIDWLVLDSIAVTEAVVMATSDMRAAIRWFKDDASNANTFGIAPNMIFSGGISAGAITANHAAVIDENDVIPSYIQNHIDNHGGLEGNSNDITAFDSSVQGVLNFSGGLSRVDWIDENTPPFYSAHDDLDEVVPCGYANSSAFFFPLFIYGSCEMNDLANQLGIYSPTYLVENSNGHVSYFTNETTYLTVIGESCFFMRAIICDALTIEEDQEFENLEIYPNPSAGISFVTGLRPTEQYSISVINGLGQLMHQTTCTGKEQFELELEQGSYILSIVNENNGQQKSQMIVVTP